MSTTLKKTISVGESLMLNNSPHPVIIDIVESIGNQVILRIKTEREVSISSSGKKGVWVGAPI